MSTEKQNRGFRAMSPEKRKKIAAQGGRASHKAGKCHEWDERSGRAACEKARHVRRARAHGDLLRASDKIKELTAQNDHTGTVVVIAEVIRSKHLGPARALVQQRDAAGGLIGAEMQREADTISDAVLAEARSILTAADFEQLCKLM